MKLKLHNKKRFILIAANCLMLLLFAILLISWQQITTGFTNQQVAKRWQGASEISFTQISCFLPVNATASESSVYSLRTTVDAKMQEASLEAAEGGSLYVDAYAALGQLTISSTKNSVSVTAIGVGGDWFTFHPLKLRSGSYISSKDFMHDRIVLDEETAFKLFGAIDVAGFEVQINGATYQIAGVVSREDDKFTQQTQPEGALVFVDYSLLEDNGIFCYEIVLPNPIEGFAMEVVKGGFPLGSNGQAVENSTRFRVSNIWQQLTHFAKRSVADSGISYPYWENAVRISEAHLMLMLLGMIITLILPLITAVYLLVLLLRSIRTALRRKKAEYDENGVITFKRRSKKQDQQIDLPQQKVAELEQVPPEEIEQPLEQIAFEQADLEQVQPEEIEQPLEQVALEQADLGQADLEQADLEEIKTFFEEKGNWNEPGKDNIDAEN